MAVKGTGSLLQVGVRGGQTGVMTAQQHECTERHLQMINCISPQLKQMNLGVGTGENKLKIKKNAYAYL